MKNSSFNKSFLFIYFRPVGGRKVEENLQCIFKVGQGKSPESRVPDSAAEKTQ